MSIFFFFWLINYFLFYKYNVKKQPLMTFNIERVFNLPCLCSAVTLEFFIINLLYSLSLSLSLSLTHDT